MEGEHINRRQVKGEQKTRARSTGDDMNMVVIEGRLSSAPRQRVLPSGSTLLAYEVSTRSGGVTRSVPVVWIDPSRPPRVTDGDSVVVVGSIRRRFFRAGGSVASRTEIEAEVVARAGTGRAARARHAVASRVADALDS